MLVLQFKEGDGVPSPPTESPLLTDDPAVNNDWRPHDLRFTSDGLAMYVVGYKTPGTDTSYVYQYDLSTAWDVQTATYSKGWGTTTLEPNATSLEIKPDGTKMYIGGEANQIHEYDLSVAWDVTTATYSENSSGDIKPGVGSTQHVHGMYIKPDDGSRLYLAGPHSNNEVQQHTLSTHWNISSQSYDASSTTVGISYSTSIYMKSTGNWLYVLDFNFGTDMKVSQHGLTVPWAISTTAAALATVDITGHTSSPTGLAFSTSGHRMYIADSNLRKIVQFTLGTDWMISTTNLS